MVTRRAVADLVRTAALGSYGVTGLADRSLGARLLRLARLADPAIRVRLTPTLEIHLWITVAWGLPVAEVARQLDSAIRYAIRRALTREVDSLVIHVNRLRIDGMGTGASPTAPVADGTP